jgi:hypothetical protein
MFVGTIKNLPKSGPPETRVGKGSGWKACQIQTLELITNIHKLREERSFITLGPGPRAQCYKTFYVRN